MYSGFSPDINAFGWAFATASTRALRNPDVVNEDGPTLVPGIDFASHSFSPNCEVIATEENYFLIAKKDVAIGEALTINYGEFSNAQLLADYGFSMDVNPYDLIKLKCEPMLINTARVVMNLGAFSNDEYIQRLGRAEQANVPPLNTRGLVSVSGQTVNVHPPGYALIGRGAYALDEKWLHSWQKRWLDLLDLYGSRGTKAVNIGGSKLTDIDGKLWAYLRIVYSDRESDITRHGFDPFILQRVSSVTSIEVEQQVVRTLIGIFAVLLHGFETDWQSDFDALTQGDLSIAKRGGGARDTIADAQAYIRQAQQTLRKRKTQLSDQISVTVPAIDCINVMADRNNGSDDVVDEKFNWNIQELLKFRIRRKRSLVELIDNLMIHFEVNIHIVLKAYCIWLIFSLFF